MARYTGVIIINVGVTAASDRKARERMELVAKRVDMKALEGAGDWLVSVDIEDATATKEEGHD